jgi:uncharacterized protein (TIGR00266 family)
MQHQILSQPSYSALKCVLSSNESIQCESGAMLAMDQTATIEGGMKGGMWKALKRTVLTSESFFVTTITATSDNTEVYLAPRAVGDITAIELENTTFIVQGGGFLASTDDIETDSHFTGLKGFFSGEGLFMIKASGNGTMFVSSFGGIIKRRLNEGETFAVDNGHLVAFEANMNYDIQKAGKGMLNMVTTGEGLITVFTGPGTVYMQTRNLRSFAESLNPFLRDRQRSQGSGILGNIFGG